MACVTTKYGGIGYISDRSITSEKNFFLLTSIWLKCKKEKKKCIQRWNWSREWANIFKRGRQCTQIMIEKFEKIILRSSKIPPIIVILILILFIFATFLTHDLKIVLRKLFLQLKATVYWSMLLYFSHFLVQCTPVLHHLLMLVFLIL